MKLLKLFWYLHFITGIYIFLNLSFSYIYLVDYACMVQYKKKEKKFFLILYITVFFYCELENLQHEAL